MVDISICMVSLNCRAVLKDCLLSLRRMKPGLNCEILLVDNASTDGTPEMVRREFPEVFLIKNGRNVGFSKGTNQGAAAASGNYILWLNTDTVLQPDSLEKLWRFMQDNPRVGAAGPKVLNADGTFQAQCRRGIPTPLVSLFYLWKLERWWPNSTYAGKYLRTDLPVDRSTPVDAVSGCCLMVRRATWMDVGPIDENIFGFGEDIDWCVRAKKKNWEVWYFAESVITHLKGQGGAHSKPYHKIWGLHQAMWIFYSKHLKSERSFATTGLVFLGIFANLAFSSLRLSLRRMVSPGH